MILLLLCKICSESRFRGFCPKLIFFVMVSKPFVSSVDRICFRSFFRVAETSNSDAICLRQTVPQFRLAQCQSQELQFSVVKSRLNTGRTGEQEIILLQEVSARSCERNVTNTRIDAPALLDVFRPPRAHIVVPVLGNAVIWTQTHGIHT
jgi:hypothetical protein